MIPCVSLPNGNNKSLLITWASSSNPEPVSLGWWVQVLGASGDWQSKLAQDLGAWGGALEIQFINSFPLLFIYLVSNSTSTRETEARQGRATLYMRKAMVRSFQTC